MKLRNQVSKNIFEFLLLVTKKRKEIVEEAPENEDDGEFNRDNFSSSQVASTFKEYLKAVKFQNSSFLEIENPIQLKLYLVF
jgi:hypothetical protein